MLRDFMVLLFAISAGFTASGIVANTYRLLGKKPESLHARAGYIAVMIVAGPSVLFDNAARAWRSKNCSAGAFWLATALSGYWSMVLGLFVIQIGLSL